MSARELMSALVLAWEQVWIGFAQPMKEETSSSKLPQKVLLTDSSLDSTDFEKQDLRHTFRNLEDWALTLTLALMSARVLAWEQVWIDKAMP